MTTTSTARRRQIHRNRNWERRAIALFFFAIFVVARCIFWGPSVFLDDYIIWGVAGALVVLLAPTPGFLARVTTGAPAATLGRNALAVLALFTLFSGVIVGASMDELHLVGIPEWLLGPMGFLFALGVSYKVMEAFTWLLALIIAKR